MGATGLDIGVESSKYWFNKFTLLIANDFPGVTLLEVVVSRSAYLAFDTPIIMP